MKKRYWIPSALLGIVGSLLIWGSYSYEDKTRSTESAGNDAASTGITVK